PPTAKPPSSPSAPPSPSLPRSPLAAWLPSPWSPPGAERREANALTRLLTQATTDTNTWSPNMQRRLIPGALLLLIGALSAAGPQQAAAAIAHRYSFTADATDSIGTAHGTVIDFGGAPTAVFTGGQLDLSANVGNGS